MLNILYGPVFFAAFPARLLAEASEKSPQLMRVGPFSLINILNMVMGLVVVIGLFHALPIMSPMRPRAMCRFRYGVRHS